MDRNQVDGQTETLANKLQELQNIFVASLPARGEEIESLWHSVTQTWAPPLLESLHIRIQNLASTAGTYGAISIYNAARNVENLLAQIKKNHIQQSTETSNLNKLTARLLEVIRECRPTTIPAPPVTLSRQSRYVKQVALVGDDDLLANKITSGLSTSNFGITCFKSFASFLTSVDADNLPDAVLLDLALTENDITGSDAIAQFRKLEKGQHTPVIFLSERRDMQARLAAVRAGATRYFTKPVDFEKLIATLNGLASKTLSNPYRVLIVDDERGISDYYAALLTHEGIVVRTTDEPLKMLDIISDFQPDLVLMDVHMPECSGLEVAAVIRQDDRHANMPIVFLSTETNLDRQLAALDLGGDDFIRKPAQPDYFLKNVVARLKRARWATRLHRELRAALTESEYRRIALDKHAIVSVTNTQGIITDVNEKFCTVSGYTRAELIGQNHRIVNSGQHAAQFFTDMWATISQGEVWHGLLQNRRKNSEPYWVDTTIVPFLDTEGLPYQYVSVRTDVTELKAAEAALAASAERLRRSQEYAHIGTWDWNMHTDELYWSDNIGPLFGLPRTTQPGTIDFFENLVHPDDAELLDRAIAQSVSSGQEYSVEHRVIWPDGTVRWLLERGDVTRDTNGQPLHMLGVVQDITKRKQAELQLVAAKNEAENANRAKSDFLSRMSHELRTPLNAILGFGQLLELDEPPLSEQQLDNVHEILKAGRHLLDLINEVLDLARIEAGRMSISIEPVNLGEVLEECVALSQPLLPRNNVRIEGMAGAASNLNVLADRTRLKQSLINLITNAIKYNRENGRVTVDCVRLDKERVRVRISDTGAGIPAHMQQHLFHSFNRLGAEHSDVEGTGIGLVITKNLVELMGGTIGYESIEGQGSRFWIELKIADADASAPREPIGKPAGNGLSNTPLTVLHIEDNPANLRLVSKIFAPYKHIALLSATDPQTGIELALTRDPNVILLDINLPELDGYEVFNIIKSKLGVDTPPVIAISANAMPDEVNKGIQAGFHDYLTKPIKIRQLLDCMEQIALR